MLPLLLLFIALSSLASSFADDARVEVRDAGGAPLASAAVSVPPGGFVPLYAAMTALHESGALTWKYSLMGGMPVVTEINGIKSALPRTAWILSATSARLGSTRFNLGIRDVDVRAGDVLLWQLWKVDELPPPPPPPHEPAAGEDEDGEDIGDDAYEGEDDGGGGGGDATEEDDDTYYGEDSYEDEL